MVSLGVHPPTEGFCQAWLGIRIDKGFADDTNLSDINIALMIDIPHSMGRGDWKVGAFIDHSASDKAYDHLLTILSGKARGTTGLLKLLVSDFLGAERANVSYKNIGKQRVVSVDKYINGTIEPVESSSKKEDLLIKNSQYWIAPDIIVAKAVKSKVRAFGRVWDFDGRSAEICQINWHGKG